MLGPLTRISNYAGRNYMRNFVRNGSHGGIPGEVSDVFFCYVTIGPLTLEIYSKIIQFHIERS